MKTFRFVLITLFLLCNVAQVWAAPAVPDLSYDTNGLNLSISWTEVPDATGYTLYYAPYPYAGPETIDSAPMGTATSFSIDLWDGAAYFIAVTAFNNSGESQYSNIEHFVIHETPVLSYQSVGLGITFSWTQTSDAAGYKLHYASEASPETFHSVDLGNKTSESYYLWEGAAFYVKVTGYTASGVESEPSKTVFFVMGPPTPEWVDDDGDGFLEVDGDCDDTDAAINPVAEEVCEDGIDQDCSGADEVCSEDLDLDGDGYSENQGDCDDSANTINPLASEICGDGIDQDCNGADEVCSEDLDLDGDGYSENQGDCDDSANTINPLASEICGDGIDQDCNGADEVCSEDLDLDGDGYSENQGDCDDNTDTINPLALEICGDGIDQDCSGNDEVCPVGPNDVDDDGDSYSVNQGDCNDASAFINPAAVDICGDGIDQDCSGADSLCPVDPGQSDDDGDGYSEDQGDCNDTNSVIHPETWETCGDGIDQDCSGQDLTCPNGESAFESELRLLINQYRNDNSLGSLAYRQGLQGLALEHNVYMAHTGVISHAGFNEIRWTRAQTFGCISLVENLGWNFQTPQAMFDGWKNSPGHNANMLDTEINMIGLSKSGAYITMLACRIL